MNFQDRVEAGRKLAERLEGYGGPDTVIYALPRGGVVVAAEVARALKSPLDLVITRKIAHPESPEFAQGAISESGLLVAPAGMDREATWFKEAVERETREALRRRKLYSRGKAIPAESKTAIIVDDGVATGLSVIAAIRELKLKKPEKVIVAVPVIAREVGKTLLEEADEVVALLSDPNFRGAVGAYYRDFGEVRDEEVAEILKSF